jgi:hypothetical protein
MTDVLHYIVYTHVHRLNQQYGGIVVSDRRINLRAIERDVLDTIENIQDNVSREISYNLEGIKTNRSGLDVVARMISFELLRLRANAHNRPLSLSNNTVFLLDRHGDLFHPESANLRVSEPNLMGWLKCQIDRYLSRGENSIHPPLYGSRAFQESTIVKPVDSCNEMLPAYGSAAFDLSPVKERFEAPPPSPQDVWPNARVAVSAELRNKE